MNAMHAGRRAGNDTQLDPLPREPRQGRGRAAQRARSGSPAGAGPGTGGAAAAGGRPGTTASAGGRPARRGKGGVPPAGREPSVGRERSVEARAVDDPAVDPAGPAATTSTGPRRRALGRYGEDLAARRLTEAGMRILDRNWRCRDGEIDIVAADGDALVVCEVKTRRAGWYEHPMAAVRPEKTARLRLLAERWLERHGGPPPGGVRIDVIGILLPARGAPVVQHARGVA